MQKQRRRINWQHKQKEMIQSIKIAQEIASLRLAAIYGAFRKHIMAYISNFSGFIA
jgi:hypothetical protein